MAWKRLDSQPSSKPMMTHFNELSMRQRTKIDFHVVKSLRHRDAIWRHGQRWLRKWLVACRHQAITRTNVNLLLIRLLRTHLNDILFEKLLFSFKKMNLKMSSARCHPFVLASICYTRYISLNACETAGIVIWYHIYSVITILKEKKYIENREMVSVYMWVWWMIGRSVEAGPTASPGTHTLKHVLDH